jgi:hypothetical protein
VERCQEPEITPAMLIAGLTAFKEWNPKAEEPAALVWAILSRALSVNNGFQREDVGSIRQ